MRCVDNHCHWDRCLDFTKLGCVGSTIAAVERYIFSKQGEYIQPPVHTNMKFMVTSFCDLATWYMIDQTLAMDNRIKYTPGYHPKYLKDTSISQADEEFLVRCLEEEHCVGLGEIGLDYDELANFTHSSSIHKQKHVFLKQVFRRVLNGIFFFYKMAIVYIELCT